MCYCLAIGFRVLHIKSAFICRRTRECICVSTPTCTSECMCVRVHTCMRTRAHLLVRMCTRVVKTCIIAGPTVAFCEPHGGVGGWRHFTFFYAVHYLLVRSGWNKNNIKNNVWASFESICTSYMRLRTKFKILCLANFCTLIFLSETKRKFHNRMRSSACMTLRFSQQK